MRISIVINAKAGSVNADLIRSKVDQALFRCERNYKVPNSIAELEEFIHSEIALKSDAIIICGGDGTVNVVLQILMQIGITGINLPRICLVVSGTANDLAFELGIDRKIQSAVRSLLADEIRKVDVIQISANGITKYMITCGGLGVPSETAELANRVRFTLRNIANATATHNQNKIKSWIANSGSRALNKMGPSIYSLMLFFAYFQWKNGSERKFLDWNLEIIPKNSPQFKTQSGFVFINNQPSLGAQFFPAPYTTNDDGLVNLLIAPVSGWYSLIETMLKIQNGTLPWDKPDCSLETPEVIIRNSKMKSNLTFFGDGEILFSNVAEINIKCLPRALTFYTS